MRKPRIFIASAVESLDVADAFNVNLDHQAEVTVWKNGFSLSQTTIDALVKTAETMDFAIFIFTPDDVISIRNREQHVVRDNVVFELGLFTGTLGKDRCFIVKPRDTDLHLPTDLLGLTPADYDGARSDGNLEAAVNHPCVLIKKEISKLGLVTQDAEIQKKERRKFGYDYKVGDIGHRLLANVLHNHANSPEGVSAWSIFNGMKGIDDGVLSLSIIKLERMGYLDRRIMDDGQRDYFTFEITADGIDYMLENESLLHKANKRVKSKAPEADNFDEDIPF